MAYKHETDHPANRDSMRVVNNERSGGAVWFIAGAVVIALVVVAFVIGSDRDAGSTPAGANVDVDVIEPVSPEAAPETVPTDGEGMTVPDDQTALPPATEPETVPETNSAN